MASKARRPRKSKLDAHTDIVGVLPDKEVAARAGVTPENVRTYRVRRGIPAGWRGETAAAAPASKAKKAPKRASARRKSTGDRRRKSKLDPFLHLLGELPDRQVADLAGVSSENVRSFRVRRGVPALWRGEGRTVPAAKPVAKPAPPKQAPAPKQAGQAPELITDSGSERSWAWRVVVDVDGEAQSYVSFGSDVVAAAVAATTRVEELHAGARIREITILAEAL